MEREKINTGSQYGVNSTEKSDTKEESKQVVEDIPPIIFPEKFKYIRKTLNLIRENLTYSNEFEKKVFEIAQKNNNYRVLRFLKLPKAKKYLENYARVINKNFQTTQESNYSLKNIKEIKNRVIISKSILRKIIRKELSKTGSFGTTEIDLAITTIGYFDWLNENIVVNRNIFDISNMDSLEAVLSNIENSIADIISLFKEGKEVINVQNLIYIFNQLDFNDQTNIIEHYFKNSPHKSVTSIIAVLSGDNDKKERLINSAIDSLPEENKGAVVSQLFSYLNNEGKKKFLSAATKEMNPELLSHIRKIYFKD